jgi:hypothetical protein
MDTQSNRYGRRKRRRKPAAKKKAEPIEPIIVAARRPDSPRLEKPTRRMKAASAKPRTEADPGSVRPLRAVEKEEPKKRRAARIITRKEDDIDEKEQMRRRLLSQYMASEGRAAITRAADNYFDAGFEFPMEQGVQIRLLEHFDEARSLAALGVLKELLSLEEPEQAPVLRQRVKRLEENAEDKQTQDLATEIRKMLQGAGAH